MAQVKVQVKVEGRERVARIAEAQHEGSSPSRGFQAVRNLIAAASTGHHQQSLTFHPNHQSVPPMRTQSYLSSNSTTPSTTSQGPDSSLLLLFASSSQQPSSSGQQHNLLLLLLFALLVLINLIVILGNILVIVAVYASAKLRNVTNIFIVSLATADLLLGVLVLPYALVYEVSVLAKLKLFPLHRSLLFSSFC